jgi:hypothetical protein
MHIYAADKSDYCEMPDDAPVHPGTVAGIEQLD